MKIWTFCEAFYGRKAVASLCLNMQNQFGINVGLVIWLCWHSVHNRYVTNELFDCAKILSNESDSLLIAPIRAIRKNALLKEQFDGDIVYQHLLQAEILLEKSVLLRLDEQLTHKTSLGVSPKVMGLSDYLLSKNVENAEESARFLYASALSSVV